nr:RNA-directed DNA polymerase, eukaryota [Tanacetum cinerariifolium]
NGDSSSFWEDKWYAGGVIKEFFPRLYALELHKHATVRMKLMAPSLDNSFRRRVINLVPCEDRYFWSLEREGDYSVASIRNLIDEKRFQEVGISTRWVKSVPSKVNITAWKIKTNALPTRFNLSRRGMDIDTLMCPVCKGMACVAGIYSDSQQAEKYDGRSLLWFVVFYMEFQKKALVRQQDSQKALIFDNLVSLSFNWCILQFVFLGVEGRRVVPDWILRLANDRVGWDKYPWGSNGNLHVARLTPDDIEARSKWWVSDPTNNSFWNMRTPTNWQTPMPSQPGPSNWQSQMAAQSATPFMQPAILSHPGTYNWQSQIPSHMGNPKSQTLIETHPDDAGLLDQNIPNRGKREQCPSYFRRTPYMEQAPTTVLPKQRDCYMKGYSVPSRFWRQLVPYLCTPDIYRLEQTNQVGWLSGDHMNSWMELQIRSRPENAPWTVAKTGTVSIHPENHRFMIETDQHIIGTLDGTTRPYPSWNDVDWESMPLHVAGNHWVTRVIHLPTSHFYVFDSMCSEGTKNLISKLIKLWTPLINNILQECGCFNATRGRHCFEFSYNDGLGVDVPQQPNFSDCGVIT